jgi:pimeloyl-ACP methyl ester carboxylesterase
MSEVPARVSAALAQILPMLRVEGEQIDYEKYRGTGDWSIRRMAADIPNTGLHPYFYSLEQAYKYSEHANWKDVHVPTLIIHGQNDTVIPVASVQKLAGDIGAHLTIVPGANHILVLNNIPEVADQIKEFLKTLKKPAK